MVLIIFHREKKDKGAVFVHLLCWDWKKDAGKGAPQAGNRQIRPQIWDSPADRIKVSRLASAKFAKSLFSGSLSFFCSFRPTSFIRSFEKKVSCGRSIPFAALLHKEALSLLRALCSQSPYFFFLGVQISPLACRNWSFYVENPAHFLIWAGFSSFFACFCCKYNGICIPKLKNMPVWDHSFYLSEFAFDS